jgi:nitric oxide reductase NorD protein
MALDAAFVQEIEQRLARYSPALPDTFHEALDQLRTSVDEAALALWLDEALKLAAHSLRSWEATADYFRASPFVLPMLDEQTFSRWAQSGRDLAEMSAAVAGAYFRASPTALPHLAGAQISEWSLLGQRLYKGTWKSISLASEFFAGSPVLMHSLSLPEMARLVRILDGVSERSAELAAACLESSIGVFSTLDRHDRHAFLDFAAAVADASWPESNLYFQKGPELLRHVDPDQRSRYLDLSARVARRLGRQAYTLFAEGAAALRQVDDHYHHRLIDLADSLVATSPAAAMAFLKSAPEVMVRLKIDEVEEWHFAGAEILRDSFEGGEAYFRLESGKAEQVIQSLSARIDLNHVSELLRLYAKALTGSNISVHPIGSLEEKGIGWVTERGPSTEGTSVYLPEFIEAFGGKTENFSVYKVYTTHQAAHLEFGSFWFDYTRPGLVFERRRHQVERERRRAGLVKKRQWLTDMERFFDLFPERQLGSDLFALAEDARIDSFIAREYGGIRRANRIVQESELARRQDIRQLPLKEAFVENLVRASLGGERAIEYPRPLRPLLLNALQVLNAICSADATVEDSAEAALLLYDIAEMIPNISAEDLKDLDWENLSEDDLEMMRVPPGSTGGQDGMEPLPVGDEEAYQSPEQVDFRGDFKPELVQLLMRLRLQQGEQKPGAEAISPLTLEQLQELFEKSVEINITGMTEGDLASTIGLFLTNLEKEAGTPIADQQMKSRDGQAADDEPEPTADLAVTVKTFYYDEWDFRAADYKPRWCAVRERVLEEGSEDFFDKALRDHSSLVAETQRQFELLKPETFRKIKRLEDGEDIDLDAALDFLIHKKAGHGDIPKIYWRRNKVERDVAVAFLLDMSASTDEEIEKRRKSQDDDDFDDDPRKYFQWLAQRRAQQIVEPPKRIIDLEKESLVLLTRALEAIGDRYGIYGFSGYGRDNVEYYVIKDLEETFAEAVRRRIDKVTPIRSTRMGPAIRHTAAKLLESDAKVKILFLVSDGRPQDHGYGRDRTEKEYAIHDTHKALVEAKHKGIIPFALTVDKEGHDYLGQMCGDIGYEILGDIEILPSRLPTLYRKLTE